MIFMIKMMIYKGIAWLRIWIGLPAESLKVKRVRGEYRGFLYEATLDFNGATVRGYGEEDSRFEALAKSISESFERSAFLRIRDSGKESFQSSSGWAAHVTKKLCQQAACNELLERDAGMMHWLTETPYLTISADSLPSNVVANLKLHPKRYKNLKFLLSTLGHVPTISCIFQDDRGFGVMSHCFKSSFDKALEKAASEAIGLLHTAERVSTDRHYQPKDQDKAVHAQLRIFSQEQPIPTWVFGDEIDYDAANLIFRSHIGRPRFYNFEFTVSRNFPLVVGKATSSAVQGHYWGPTEEAIALGKINFNRIGSHHVSLKPHFVL